MSRAGRLLIAAAVAAVTFGIASAVQASIPDANGLIHGCYKTNNGSLRVIDSASSSCAASETPLNWSQRGPTGRKGATGATGPSGPTGASGPISGYEEVTTETVFTDFSSPDPAAYQVLLYCPAGKQALGGGATVGWYGAAGYIQLGFVAQDGPTATGTGWSVLAEQPTSPAVTQMPVHVSVLCANVAP
jgi:hypothetical protein